MSAERYAQQYRILSSDTDLHQRLRLSRLFTLLQEAAIAHTEDLGFPREKTLDRGWLWVVLLQQVKVNRLPVYDDIVRLESVPGEFLHGLYPRYYRINDFNGTELLTAASVWTLINGKTRTMAPPAETGVVIPGMEADWECCFPRMPKTAVSDQPIRWTVPYSVTDINGHMNNARYLDLAEDFMPPELRDGRIRELRAEYAAEVRLGQTMELRVERRENVCLFSGFTDRRIFRLSFEYDPE